MKLSRGKSSVWLWCCIALIALGVLLIFSVSGTVVFRARPTISPSLDCVNGEEDDADDCDLGADFDADFELHPEIIVRNSFCDGVNCHIIQSTVLFDQCCSETGLPRPSALSVSSFSSQIFFKGVNLAGGEREGDDARRGEFIPFANNAALFIWKGMNTFRIPIVWEYFADIRGNIFTTSNYVVRLDRLIAKLITRDVAIIIDLHNYMRYNPSNITLDRVNTNRNGVDVIGLCQSPAQCTRAPGEADFITLWRNIAKRYNDSRIVYDLMNEPHDVASDLLIPLFVDTIDAIRAAEGSIRHAILVPSNHFSSLSFWFQPLELEARSNAENMALFLKFPSIKTDNGIVLTINQYFDADLSGTYKDEECMATSLFIPQFDANWAKFKNWSITNNVTSFVGSFGVPDTLTCRANLVHFLDALESFALLPNKTYGIIGWTAWAAGRGLVDDARSLAPGGRANQLIWDPAVYGRYLTPLNVTVEPLENVTRAMQITNNLDRPLHFLDGYLPFQFRGNASIAPGATGYLYSNNEETTPTYRLQIKYFVDTKDNQVVFGFTTPSNSNIKIAYSAQTETSFFHIVNFSVGCPIQATGPNATRGEPRCFRVNLNSDTTHDIVRG